MTGMICYSSKIVISILAIILHNHYDKGIPFTGLLGETGSRDPPTDRCLRVV